MAHDSAFCAGLGGGGGGHRHYGHGHLFFFGDHPIAHDRPGLRLWGWGISGIFTHRFLLHKEPYETDDQSWHSLWGVISEGIWKLDPISVRPLVIAVAVSVILGVALPFPTAVGVVCGLLIGNHLAICIGHWNGKPKPTLDVRPEGRAPAAPSRAMRALDLASPPPRARPARVAPQALQGPQAHLQPDG